MRIRGFSLVEILVVVSILLILIFSVFMVMEAGKNAWFTSDVSVELRRQIIKTFMIMEQELKATRPAQISLPIGSSNSSLIFKIPQDNDGDGTILNSFGNIEWSNDTTYSLSAANQITRTASGITTVLANNIITLQFTRPESSVNLLQIDITARKTSSTGRLTQDTGQIIIKMRN